MMELVDRGVRLIVGDSLGENNELDVWLYWEYFGEDYCMDMYLTEDQIEDLRDHLTKILEDK